VHSHEGVQVPPELDEAEVEPDALVVVMLLLDELAVVIPPGPPELAVVMVLPPVPVAVPQMPFGHDDPVDVAVLPPPPHMTSEREPPIPTAARTKRKVVGGMNAPDRPPIGSGRQAAFYVDTQGTEEAAMRP